MEETETTLGFLEEPKVEVDSPPLSPRDSDDDDDETEPDDSDGEEEEGGAGVRTGAAVASGPPLKKGPWTPDEDKRLRTYVEANGEGNWNHVQRNAGLNRCGKSCRLRWANHLRPHLKKGPFSKEEEQKIIELHARHGNKWAKMASACCCCCVSTLAAELCDKQEKVCAVWPWLPVGWEYAIINSTSGGGGRQTGPRPMLNRCQHQAWACYIFLWPTVRLPGRTDNEIKNFWNTRSKRLSKAGLGLYPDGLLKRVASQERDCHSPEDTRGKKRPNELSQGSCIEFDDIVFEKLDYKKRAENFLAPTFIIPDSLPMDSMNHPLKRHASSGMVSGYSGNPTCEQFPHEAEKTCYTDINPEITRNHSFPFNNAIATGPPILDGNFSTSGTIQRPVKMELPSVQHTGFESINSWPYPLPPATPLELADNCIVSPASVLSKPECFPSQDSGLLDAMVQQGHVLGDSTNFQGAYEGLVPPLFYGYYLSSPSSGFGDNLLEGSPLDEFRTSRSPASLDALLGDGKHQADDIFADKCLLTLPDPCRLDAAAEARFLNEDSAHSEFQPMNGPLSAILYGDPCDEAGDGHQLGLESAPWKSMPGARHMSES